MDRKDTAMKVLLSLFVLTCAGALYQRHNDNKTRQERIQIETNERYQSLSLEVRKYDANRDGFLSPGELEALTRDYDLKARAESRTSPESR